MGILNSLISLAVVVGAGYITITYIIPKIEGTSPKDDSSKIVEDIAGIVSGEPPAETEEEKPKKQKKPYDPSKGMAGKGESKKKKKKGGEEKAKKEILYIIGDEYWEY